MTDTAVQSILDVARYLRSVRPLDPAELQEYVTGEVDASTVRSTLKSHAYDLGIHERSDGRFVPVPTEPYDRTFHGVEELPRSIEDRLEDLLEERWGPEWYAGETGDTLREAIRTFKEAYYGGSEVTYTEAAAFGYAIYHLPGAFAKTQYVMDVLGSAGALDRTQRILEIGPGVGGSALGLATYLDASGLVDYHGIEPSEPAATICEELLGETHRNFHWSLERSTVEDASLEGTYDLVVLANVASELDDPIAIANRVREHLADAGSLVLIEPADERTSRSLRRIERQLPAFDVFAPTLRLWPGMEPEDACWSFDERDPLAIPRVQQALDQGARAHAGERDPATREFVNEEMRFAYSILRTDGTRWSSYRPSRGRFAPLRDVESEIAERVDVAVVKLSHSLATDEANPLFVIGDGSQREEHFAVNTHQTALNAALRRAAYGDILHIKQGLVLWNRDEEAYNLIVDEETIVDQVAAI